MAGKHPSQDDPFETTSAMKDLVADSHPEFWHKLDIDPRIDMGSEDTISLFLSTEKAKVHKSSIGMREVLLSPNGSALRAICLMFAVDFYVLSYRFPSGCDNLNV